MGFMLFRKRLNKFNEKIVNMENMSVSTLLISHIFRSVGQVMFLDCPVAGAFICIGIVTAQPQDLAFGLLATMTALFMTLKMLGPHVFQGLLRRNLGLFGFNAVLVGIGISVFLNWDKNSIGDWFLLLIPTILFGVFSSFIKMMIESLTHTLPCLTFPFNLTMTVWLTFSYAVAWAPSAFVSSPATSRNVVDDFEEYLEEIDVQKVAQAIMKGFSQVYLVDSWECGVLILVGMLYHDVEVAILALLGSSIGTFGALLMGVNKIAIYKGLFGFNSCLVAIVCGKVLVNLKYLHVRHKRYLSALLFSLFTVPMQICTSDIFALIRIPCMTYPFCFMATLFLLIERWVHEHVKSEQIRRRSSIIEGAGKLKHQRTVSAITAALKSLANEEEGRASLKNLFESDDEDNGNICVTSTFEMQVKNKEEVESGV